MTDNTAKPVRRRFIRPLCLWVVGLTGLFFALAHTLPVIVFAQRQARGTSMEGPLRRWYLSIYGGRIERALASGHIRQGQPVEEVIEKHGPFRVRDLGPYQYLEPPGEGLMAFEGYTMIAKDGQLAAVGWYTCTGHVIFFDTLTEQDHSELSSRRQEHGRKLFEARSAARMAIAGAVLIDDPYNLAPFDPLRDVRMAVAGIAAYTEPDSQPQPDRE